MAVREPPRAPQRQMQIALLMRFGQGALADSGNCEVLGFLESL